MYDANYIITASAWAEMIIRQEQKKKKYKGSSYCRIYSKYRTVKVWKSDIDMVTLEQRGLTALLSAGAPTCWSENHSYHQVRWPRRAKNLKKKSTLNNKVKF